jgi:predicted PurR-regulated permease PerM
VLGALRPFLSGHPPDSSFWQVSAFVKEGPALVSWLRAHAPLRKTHFDRFARAYAETARGLVVGVGLTALIQGVLATLTYAIVGVPRALALGLLTTVSALIPGFGTGLFWGPIALVLAVQGYPGKALVVVLSGIIIIGSVDNVLKPILANRAHLTLSPTLLFVTMLSGLAAFGPSGLIFGPLSVRLAIEGLEIARAYSRAADLNRS